VANVDELINTINETSNVGNVDSLIDLINETPNEVEDWQTENEEQNEFEVLIENDVDNQVNYENTDGQPMTQEEYRRQQDELIWRLYTEGKSYRKIAKEVGISDKTVARRIKKIIKRTI
jgi:DNA-binding NarL/FixJ family response regulator